MSVGLINPPWFVKQSNFWHQIRSSMPPLGLLYVAATLEQAGIEVVVYDFQARFAGWQQVENELRNLRHDWFGLTATTSTIGNAYRLTELIRRLHPRAQVVLGGVHATALPEEALARPDVDFVVRGEGEEAMVKLVRGEIPATIPGVSYRAADGFRHVRPDGLMRDLDTIPFPAFHLVDLRRYRPALGANLNLPAINMVATRGCPGRCTFCNSASLPLRKRSAENIFAEIEMLHQKYGIREIQFYDDTFTVFHRNLEKLCDLLIARRLKLSWCCFARTDLVTAELLQKMKQAGCHQIMYGIESADESILRNIQKHVTLAQNRRAVAMAKAAGLTVRCTFMFGNPGETEETLDRTLTYARELNPHIALFNITTPYPGTAMFAWAKEHGYLLTENWDDYNLSEPILRLPTVAPDVIKRKYRRAHRAFYLHPSVWWNWLRTGLPFTHLRTTLRGLAKIAGFS